MFIHIRDMESGIQHLEIGSGLKESSLELRDDILTCKVINLLDLLSPFEVRMQPFTLIAILKFT
jgi:hypothetical protein